MKEASAAVTLTDSRNGVAIKGKSVSRVSKKFYADLDGRVRGAIYRIGCCHDAYVCAKIVIDRYISDGTEPDLSELITVRLIFALLKPEIDKAIARSRMAKERAAARRSVKSMEQPGQEQPEVSDGVSGGETMVGLPETVDETMPTVEQDADMLIEKFNAALTAAASEDKDLRPLNRRERRDLKRRMQKAKKRALPSA